MKDSYVRKAKLIRVIDGDTFEMEIDLGFILYLNSAVRLAMLDTPECRGAEKLAGLYVKKQMLAKIKECRSKASKTESFYVHSTLKPTIFNRIVGEVYFGDFNLNEWLLDSRLAWKRQSASKIAKRDVERLSLPEGIKQRTKELMV